MITIIMSIGFSVDYSAHITYGYVISQEKIPSDRIRSALAALGWPLTQGAISTILAVSLVTPRNEKIYILLIKYLNNKLLKSFLHMHKDTCINTCICINSKYNFL